MALENVVDGIFRSKWILAVIAVVGFYLALKVLSASANRRSNMYKKELEEVLHSDEHKVKGRFE